MTQTGGSALNHIPGPTHWFVFGGPARIWGSIQPYVIISPTLNLTGAGIVEAVKKPLSGVGGFVQTEKKIFLSV